ncbi:MAG: FkbM family methyltransferase [Verrucomicrobiota bacterium]|jgi:FkbM family methyltransferase
MKKNYLPKPIKRFLRLRLGLKPLFDYVESRSRLIGVRDMPIKTVFDVGANVGKMSRLYRRIFPEAMIYSIEPVPACYEILSSWAETQNGQVKTFNLAMGQESGQTCMWWNQVHLGGSSLVKSRFQSKNGAEIQIQIETLDRLAAKLDLRDEILVKIDTEGYDLEVIRGGSELLRRASVVIVEIILVEAPGETPHFGQFMNVLGDMGYMFRGCIGFGFVEGVPMGCDAVFIKQPSFRRHQADSK